MSTDTQGRATTPPTIARHQNKTSEEFDRIMEDATTLQCFARYCLALLDKLEVRRHWLREIVLPGSAAISYERIPTADQEEQLLQRFADTVRERHPRFCEVYEDDILSQLQYFSYLWLSQNAGYAESQEVLKHAANKIGDKVTRPWDNPVRFVTDPVTGKRSLDATSTTTVSQFLGAQAFLKELDPARPARKPGRRKGANKPKGSGRAPLPGKESLAVFQAIEGDGKDWIYCARTILKKKIPSEHQERERLRAYVGRLKYNGGTLSKKSVR